MTEVYESSLTSRPARLSEMVGVKDPHFLVADRLGPVQALGSSRKKSEVPVLVSFGMAISS